MSVKLHHYDCIKDPISTIVQAWMALSEHSNYSELPSGYHWNSAGDLPVLQYNHHIIQKSNIIPFLNLTFNLDEDLPESDQHISKSIQDTCFNSLEPAILFSLWAEDETAKDFWAPKGSFWEKLLTGPVVKVIFTLEKGRITESLRKNFNVETPAGALAKCKAAHKRLSALLGNKKFFFSSAERPEYPRAADLVVYGFLKYQMMTLRQHAQVQESLEKFENLMKLVLRVEDAILLKAKAGLCDVKGFEFIRFQVQGYCNEEFFGPKVFESSLDFLDGDFNYLLYKNEWELPPLRSEKKRVDEESEVREFRRRAYVTGGVLGIFLFFYLRR